MQHVNHYFITDGERESGNYKVYEVINGEKSVIYEVDSIIKGGLKECRQYIGSYLVSKYKYTPDRIVPHQCVKSGRKESKNPWHFNCTVKDYLDGIDPQNKSLC